MRFRLSCRRAIASFFSGTNIRLLPLKGVSRAVNFLLFSTYDTIATLAIGTMVAGFSYGVCLSIFPAATAMLYGVKNLGVNYGLVFTSWGAGGVFGGLIGGLVRDWTGSYNTAFLIASALCAAGVILSLLIKEPEKICA